MMDFGLFVTGCKMIGAGMAAVGMLGTGVGLGIIFGALILAVARNPELRNELMTLALLGLALTEAIALFALMLSFLILFG